MRYASRIVIRMLDSLFEYHHNLDLHKVEEQSLILLNNILRVKPPTDDVTLLPWRLMAALAGSMTLVVATCLFSSSHRPEYTMHAAKNVIE